MVNPIASNVIYIAWCSMIKWIWFLLTCSKWCILVIRYRVLYTQAQPGREGTPAAEGLAEGAVHTAADAVWAGLVSVAQPGVLGNAAHLLPHLLCETLYPLPDTVGLPAGIGAASQQVSKELAWIGCSSALRLILSMNLLCNSHCLLGTIQPGVTLKKLICHFDKYFTYNKASLIVCTVSPEYYVK